MITFTRAPTVAPGDPIVSDQLVKLAAAFNDRLRSGLGDPTWRLHFYWLSLFRQVRNSDAEGNLFPPMAEFFTAGYQVLDPAVTNWPVAGYSEPEGANLACQIMAYVFGAAAINLDSEATRLTNTDWGGIPLYIRGAPPATDQDFWDLAKEQRGGFDAATMTLGSPAWKAARSHYKVAMSARSPHGNAYGGYLPSPELSDTPCLDPNDTDDYPPPLNYVIFFTALKPGLSDIVYPGTCQSAPGDSYHDHIKFIYYTAWAYYVVKNDNSIDVLPTSDYVEGPYTGEAKLRKTANGALNRVLQSFSGEFRGSDSQRSVKTYWLDEAFDMQAFLTKQYHLAPSIGFEADGSITPNYPYFSFSGSASFDAGAYATHAQTLTQEHAWDAQCVMTGCMVNAFKLTAPCTIELLNDNTVIKTIDLVPEGVGGVVAKMVLLTSKVRPNPFKVRLATAATFTDNTGMIEVECTELLEGKPTLEDLFLLLRLSGMTDIATTDGSGITEESSKTIGENYFKNGCITNLRDFEVLPEELDAVNVNAVFDAARRLSLNIRMVPRANLVSYAVQDGKSICWFNRTAQIGVHNVDLFMGIGPSRDPVLSGSLIVGRKYIVRTGTARYLTTDYTAGQTFTAVSGSLEYSGDGAVYEYDGMRHVAEPEGWSNEWLMGVQLKAYHPSISSIWKPDAYSDYFSLLNRCHFYSPEIANDPPLLWHTAFGNKASGLYGGVLSPESPSGYNYAPLTLEWNRHNSVNQIDCGDADCIERRKNFYRSCRLYEPDPEIESVIADPDNPDLLKVTFTGRFHHTATAPATIGRDVATWDKTALRAESSTIRTMENALREYLVLIADGTNATNDGPGNNAANSTVQENPDNPYGSVYPTFLFTKLIPKPYEDANSDQDPTDTPVTHDQFAQMEIYLRAMCEGYVDGQTSSDYACLHNTTSIFDFSFDSLCLQAFGNRWFNLLPMSVRPDNAEGHGPLPNTEIMADCFNQFSAALNLLTDVRVMLPMKLEVASDLAFTVQRVTVNNADGTSNASCSPDQVCAVYWTGTPPDVQAPSSSTDWAEGVTSDAYVYSFINGQCDGSGQWDLETRRMSNRIRWKTADPDAIEAIPEAWRDMLQDNATVLASVTITSTTLERYITTFDDSQHCCYVASEPCPGWWQYGPGQYLKFVENTTTDYQCTLMRSRIDAPAVGYGVVARGRRPDEAECNPGPQTRYTAEPILDASAMISVPLV